MGNALACRSDLPVLLAKNVRQNLWLWGAIGFTCVLQIAVIYVPGLQTVFDTQALTLSELLICLAMGVVVFILIEFQKRFLPLEGNPKLTSPARMTG